MSGGAIETSNTRRRRNNHPNNVPSSSSATASYGGDFNHRLYNSNQTRSDEDNDGGQQKSRKDKRKGRLFRRNQKAHLTKLSNMCAKFGKVKLRTVDILFIVAAIAKIISVIHSAHKSKVHRRSMAQPNAPVIMKAGTHHPTDSSIWALPKWVERWRHHKMPFFSPVLYRRGDDDYAYYESNLDDYYYQDPTVHHSQNTAKVEYIGMFRGSTYKRKYLDTYEAKKKKITKRGYAFVDDTIYSAERMRYGTASALKMFFPIVNDNMIAPVQHSATFGAFDALDEDGNAPHYINDDDSMDVYYSYDDDFVRGTHGMGLYSEYKKEESHADDEWYEEEEESHGEEPNPLSGRGYDFWHSTEGKEETVCTRPAFHRGNHPTCNELHSLASGYTWLLGEEVYSRRWKNRKQLSKENVLLSKFLGAGYFRHAFLLERIVGRDENIRTNEEGAQNQWDDVVFKIMQQLEEESGALGFAEDDEVRSRGWGYNPADKYTYLGLVEYMRIDSNVMELLTPSPRAASIFSYCGTSSITEFTPIDIEDYVSPTLGNTPKKLHHEPDEYPYLDLPLNDHVSWEEKLEIALEMAKCVAAMHGNTDGPIVNVDIQLGQFFRGKDGKIKLVDFNRAEPLLYDTKKEEYCKWRNGMSPDGSLRAPEENVDAGLTEQVDVFSLGNVFYTVLTGVTVWEGYDLSETIRNIVEGVTMPIDDIFYKTFSSEVLAQAISLCWTYDAEERPTIFEIVRFLEQAIESNIRNPHGGTLEQRLANGEHFEIYG